MAPRTTKKAFPGPDLSTVKDFGQKMGQKLTDNMGNFNFGRMAEDIMGTFMGAQSEGRSRIKTELEKLLQKFDLVTRREFDAVREIAIAARTQAEELAEQLNGKKKPAAKPAARKAPVKKAAAKSTAKTTAAKKPVKKATRAR